MKFKNVLAGLIVSLAGVGMVATPLDADAKRLGGGRPAGMQRQMPAKPAPTAPDATPNPSVKPGQPANQAAPTPAQPTPGAQPGKRSWLGPIAGLAAGLGIAALMSHFGLGEAFGQFLTLALVALLAFVVIGWLMRRLRPAAQGPQLAGAGAPFGQGDVASRTEQGMARQAFGGTAPSSAPSGPTSSAAAPSAPADFDAAGFTRIAKMIFIRLQAANDAGNIEDLRKFTTPELFASLRLDIQERGQQPNQTDVMQLDAELVDTAQQDGQWIATVRFHGLIREEADQGAQPFNELWHLVKPVDGQGEWAIAGITPV
jgi:predicted lipid-binding transport protein (Tim44 family)